tara:strand:- start:163 stop:297 length:135 start_codon:yes stop_codon:yes gene_type:complete
MSSIYQSWRESDLPGGKSQTKAGLESDAAIKVVSIGSGSTVEEP